MKKEISKELQELRQTRKIILKVKDKSVVQFMIDNLADQSEVGKLKDPHPGFSNNISAYHLMKTELLFKKSEIITPVKPATEMLSKYITIELEDRASGSGVYLLNKYTYKIMPYDDICVKLILVDFEVETGDNSSVQSEVTVTTVNL